MRVMEAIRLQPIDVDFDRNVIVLREANDNNDRVVLLPKTPCGDFELERRRLERCDAGPMEELFSAHRSQLATTSRDEGVQVQSSSLAARQARC